MSEHAAEAECRALIAEQQGRGGSLRRDLHLLKQKFSKPASSTQVASEGTTLQSDGDKLNRWAEYFKEVVNCQVNADVVSSMPSPLSPFLLLHQTPLFLTKTCLPHFQKKKSTQPCLS